MITDGVIRMLGRHHLTHAQRTHHVTQADRCDIRLAFVHPATHGRVKRQIEVLHQNLSVSGLTDRLFHVIEGVAADHAGGAFGEQELAV